MEIKEKRKIIRNAPRPLIAHISMAANNDFSEDELLEFFSGIQKYQHATYKRAKPDTTEVWSKGCVRILKRNGVGGDDLNIVIIPSLVNNSDIVDLIEERSFAGWLSEQSKNVYYFDWGNIVEDANINNLDDVVGLLLEGISFLHEIHGSLNVAGYCMGGMLALAATVIDDENKISSLALFASPWDFRSGEQKLTSLMDMWSPAIITALSSADYMPMDWLQTIFAAVSPDNFKSKFINFNKLDDESMEYKIFIAVEDWANNGNALPSTIAMKSIKDFYIDNITEKGHWYVNGINIIPEEIKIPAFFVIPLKDKLVPAISTKALSNKMSNATIIEPECGHIGMMAGSKSLGHVWLPYYNWLKG